MSLLKNINDNFFNPFCCKNKEVYWECIKLLIEASKTVAVLYEQDAKDRISLYLENCQYVLETENIGEEISGQYSAQDNASAIIRYFRRCGWLSEREIGRSGSVPFAMYKMSAAELADARNQSCLLPLTQHDRERLAFLRENPEFRGLVDYMLEHNVKLEQEIVSLGQISGRS